MWVLIVYAMIALLHFATFLWKYIGGPFDHTQVDRDIPMVQVGKIMTALAMSSIWIIVATANSFMRCAEWGE